ncbi:DUF805 domain-containing protein [Clavibacter nebraskensis]|uniref:DUF805 domain-containing protein n=1 Tax=Clavibacter nebraskensis TaxID=31963 RepID=A0A399Q3T5_9MICO|nr:DUF805 domain-containing protein [Clavibacter nebraskensis]QGV65675.1 DUF805 domain-containing protein [Clavibacter nebraskensis]RIJ13360.1 DUF805 domain-containing protein [Clavibacter nebraskensis]UKF28176.1 DUF805 domain-containing protein [Clavibacter nebraskensis]UQB13810.1 DUF805 domain-containing protein [Clavibacter nebraskensis]UQB16642.1 DUF805 domain-containing protein [Clavibacter nebraskensis]
MTAAMPPGSTTPLELPLYGASWREAMRRFFLKYATFRGRASRSEFWWCALTGFVVSSALRTLSSLNTDSRESLGFFDAVTVADSWSAVLGVLQLAFFIPSFAVSWRRLHDVDRSGTWTFINFIPLLGTIVYVIMTAGRSRPGGARFD